MKIRFRNCSYDLETLSDKDKELMKEEIKKAFEKNENKEPEKKTFKFKKEASE